MASRVCHGDEIMLAPDKLTRELIIDFETRPLRELRELIANSGLAEVRSSGDVAHTEPAS